MAALGAAATAYLCTMALTRILLQGGRPAGRLERIGSPPTQADRGDFSLNGSLRRMRGWDKLDRLLRLANWRVTSEEYVLIGVVSVAGSFVFGTLPTGNPWLGLAFAGFAVLILAEAPRSVGRKRMSLFDEQLEEALATMANSLKAGLSLVQAVEVAARGGQSPLRGEFGVVLEQYEVGLSLNEAFERLRDRMDSEDLKFFTQALSVHRESGGNLAEILSGLADTIRDRRMLRCELQSRTAEARSAANVLLAALPALTLYFFMAQPDMIRPLLEEPMGEAALGYAAASWVTGVFAAKRILEVPETR